VSRELTDAAVCCSAISTLNPEVQQRGRF
jgi:hypothetical protein